MAKLMKPLFINGNFNKEGKRIRVDYLKTVGEYPLWRNDGKPYKNQGRNDNDKYYLFIEKNGFVFPIGETEHTLAERAGYDYLIREWYGDREGRQKYFDDIFYKDRNNAEAHELVKRQIEKEDEFIEEWGKAEQVQADFIETMVNKSIQNYINARDSNGTFPDFIGALFLNEIEKCLELSKIRKTRLEAERKERAKQQAKERAEQEKRQQQEEERLIVETENKFRNGGAISDGEMIIKLADKYNVDIPIRTRGWILNSLATVAITSAGNIEYTYWKRSKNARGSQKAYDVFRDIRAAVLS